MVPDDPNGQDDVLIDDGVVHIPLGEPVLFWLRSKDVLHNFTVAQFRVKMDLVPGLVTYMWLEPTKVGEYEVLCEELCGVAHHAMRGRVVVDEPEDYQAWVDSQPTFAEIQARPAGDPVLGAASYALCSTCHGAEGQGNPGMAKVLKVEIKHLGSEAVQGKSDDDIKAAISGGMGKMKAVKGVSAADIDSIVAFVRTRRRQR